MAARKDPPPLKNRNRHRVELAEIAFRELSLPGSLHSKADEDRLWRIWRGAQFLDDLLAAWKASVDDLLEQFELTGDGEKLARGLKVLNVPIRLKEREEYEREVVQLPWGDALTLVNDHMQDVEDFEEPKLTALVELLLGKPVRLTSANPRLAKKPAKKLKK